MPPRSLGRGAAPGKRAGQVGVETATIAAMTMRPTRPPLRSARRTTLVIAALLALPLACSEPEIESQASHHVKVFEVGKRATGQSRRLSGRVEAADESTLSFAVGGRVVEIVVAEGQDVAEGQELARLDEEPFELAVEDARSQVNSARARLVEAEATFERVGELVAQRAAAQKDLEAATAALTTAGNDLKAAQGSLDRAQLDLRRTRLFAPFDAQVLELAVDPFEEVGAGAAVVRLLSVVALAFDLLVPETLIREVDHGAVVTVGFPTVEGLEVPAVVTRIGAAAESGNAFPVTVSLSETDADLRPGMTASVTFEFAADGDGPAYLVPLSVLALEAGLVAEPDPDDQARGRDAPVFVFDPEAGVVRYRMIKVGDLRGNEFVVYDGLEEGELVVSAGVTFLHDGMSAEVWEPRR